MIPKQQQEGKMKALTQKQQEIVSFIQEFIRTVDMPPTVTEIAEHFNLKTPTVFTHLKSLQKKGILTRTSKARSITLCHAQKRKYTPSNVQAIPLLDLYSLEMLSTPQHKSELYCDKKLLGKDTNSKDVFAVLVRGGAMRNLGILDGDVVILKRNPKEIERGDIVLTYLNGQPVLRSCYPLDGDHIELRPGNPEYQSMTCKANEFSMKGVVIGLQRSL